MPSSAVRTFADPNDYFAGIRNLEIEGLLTQRGGFRATATRIDLDRLWMHRFEECLPRVMRVTPSGARVLVLFATSTEEPATLANGIELGPGGAIVFGLNWPYYLRSSAACNWGTMSITPEDLAAVALTVTGRDAAPPTLMSPLAPRPPALARLRRLHGVAAFLAATAPELLARPGVARAIEHDLLEAMVWCVTDADRTALRSTVRQQARLMRRLDEVLRTNQEETMYMAELCAAVGATYWTLRDTCREYLGMSPKRYLWLRRMHLARRALKHADPTTATVTAIATNYGFWELGRFSVAYRSLYGEAPSTTLHCPPPAVGRE